MSPDETPVDDSEFLLRRIPSDPTLFTYPDGPVDFRAFLPNQNDKTGLSLYRAFVEGTQTGFLTPSQLLSRAESERVRQYGGIATILTAAVRAISPLSVEPEPDKLPGHATIKQINRINYDATKEGKRQIKSWADSLARAISEIPIKPRSIPS